MKLLLLFLFLTFLLAVRATVHGKPTRVWPLVLASFVVGAAYLSQRAI